MRHGLFFALCLGLCASCGDDGTPVPMGGSGTTTDASTTEAPAADGTGTTSTPVPTADGTTTTPDPDGTTTEATDDPLPYAAGIRLVRMTANQAVQVQLVEDGVEVAAEDYNTRLISGRRTLLRAYWSLHADFTPRMLIGRLVADYPDGSQLTQDFPLMVDGPSSDGGASFQWLLEPDQVVPGIEYRVRVLEADPEAATGEISDPPPILPLEGPGTLGIYDVPLQLKVELIPVLHQFGGEECMPDIQEENVQAMRELLEQNNPVQEAVFTIGEPMPYTDSIGESMMGFSPVLSALAERRAADDPPPNLYYYGALESCDGYPPGLGGQAIGIPPEPTMELAQQRISTGRWSGGSAAAISTFVHEVGHTQGRRHVLCSGGEAGTDPAYPHPQGRIGVWGFGIHDFQLRSPTTGRDYMTYCSNEWVSDYAWEQTLEIIEVLTSWDAAGAPAPEGGTGLLMGALYPDGTQQWWTAPGGLAPKLATPGAAIEVTRPDGVQTLPAWVYTRPHGETVQVIAPRPSGLPEVLGIDLRTPQRVTPWPVAPTEVRDLYVP